MLQALIAKGCQCAKGGHLRLRRFYDAIHDICDCLGFVEPRPRSSWAPGGSLPRAPPRPGPLPRAPRIASTRICRDCGIRRPRTIFLSSPPRCVCAPGTCILSEDAQGKMRSIVNSLRSAPFLFLHVLLLEAQVWAIECGLLNRCELCWCRAGRQEVCQSF